MQHHESNIKNCLKIQNRDTPPLSNYNTNHLVLNTYIRLIIAMTNGISSSHTNRYLCTPPAATLTQKNQSTPAQSPVQPKQSGNSVTHSRRGLPTSRRYMEGNPPFPHRSTEFTQQIHMEATPGGYLPHKQHHIPAELIEQNKGGTRIVPRVAGGVHESVNPRSRSKP
jgi:hypothetical protein